jgi:hypothetical protein
MTISFESAEQVQSRMRNLPILLAVMLLSIPAGFAQKVKTGHDKSVDFSKYKSYTWQAPPLTQTMPLLQVTVASSIRAELQAKGLASMDNGGGLTLLAQGSLDYNMEASAGSTADSCKNCQAPLLDPREWAGTTAPSGAGGTPIPKGTLQLEFVDRATNKVVWSGTVVQKLNPAKKQQSLDRAAAAIKALLADFPPKK